MTGRSISIGTRGSALALAQARLVAEALQRDGRASRIVVIETDGDRRAPDTAWGEGAFVAAIERALLDGRVDAAVHSAKDVPIDGDRRLRIAAYLPRADPRDALVVPDGAARRRLADLPAGTRVGTDSPRRTGFIRALRPDLVVHPLHGNVDTRLRRLDTGETDALVLACAGLDRLGRGDRIAERLSPDAVPPAPGQGAIAIQIRADDGRMLALAAAIDDRRTRIAVEAERAFLEASGGGCRAPIGALATLNGSSLELLAGHASPDGAAASIRRRVTSLEDGPSAAIALALEMAADRQGAGRSGGVDDVDDVSGHGRPGTAPARGRVLVTRAEDQAGELGEALVAAGLEPVFVPAISIEVDPPGGDLDRAVGSLGLYRWVVVTSANGARATIAAMDRAGARDDGPRWAAIGSATATILERRGIAVAFRPSRPDARTLAREVPLERRDAVLVVRGNLAGDDLAEALRARGAEVDDVIAYRTRIGPPASRLLLRRALDAGTLDAVILTSGSTVRGLLAIARAEGLDIASVPAVVIGPETRLAATDAGFPILAMSPSPDALGLAATAAAALAPRTAEIA